MENVPWFVAHTRPRREKKLAEYCRELGLEVCLPCYRSVKKYEGKTAVFHKPLFPNYVFLRMDPGQRQKVYQSDFVANLLDVQDQETFDDQLHDILRSLDTDTEVLLAPQIAVGSRVKITGGPLRGLEGIVENRSGVMYVHLRLDFIGQAVAVRVDASDLELT